MHLWKIALDGNRLDLEAIVQWFPNGGVHGVQEESGSEKCYFLVGTSFDQIQEAALVHERACGALDEISAAISLLDLNFERPRIGTVWRFNEDGTCQQGFAFAAATLRGRSTVTATLSANGQGQTGETQAQTLLLGAHRAKTLDVALLLWGSAVRTWPRLYRIYEEIQSFGGNRFFGAGNEKERFAHSANHPDTAGLDSRHGTSSQQPPRRPMTLDEATHFIARALAEALREAASAVDDTSV